MKNKLSKEEIRLARNKYHRLWTKKNQDKVQKINERFYRKKIQEYEELQNKSNED